MNRLFLTSILCFFACVLHAQITTGEQPYGLKEGAKLRKPEQMNLTAPDRARIEQEDMANDRQFGPVCYAYPVWVNITTENSGVWQQLSDGSRVWQLKVHIPGALSTNTYYDKLICPLNICKS